MQIQGPEGNQFRFAKTGREETPRVSYEDIDSLSENQAALYFADIMEALSRASAKLRREEDKDKIRKFLELGTKVKAINERLHPADGSRPKVSPKSAARGILSIASQLNVKVPLPPQPPIGPGSDSQEQKIQSPASLTDTPGKQQEPAEARPEVSKSAPGPDEQQKLAEARDQIDKAGEGSGTISVELDQEATKAQVESVPASGTGEPPHRNEELSRRRSVDELQEARAIRPLEDMGFAIEFKPGDKFVYLRGGEKEYTVTDARGGTGKFKITLNSDDGDELIIDNKIFLMMLLEDKLYTYDKWQQIRKEIKAETDKTPEEKATEKLVTLNHALDTLKVAMNKVSVDDYFNLHPASDRAVQRYELFQEAHRNGQLLQTDKFINDLNARGTAFDEARITLGSLRKDISEESGITKELEEKLNEFVRLMQELGVQFSNIEIGHTAFRGDQKIEDQIATKLVDYELTDDPNKHMRIAAVRQHGLAYTDSSGKLKIIKPAEVIVYRTTGLGSRAAESISDGDYQFDFDDGSHLLKSPNPRTESEQGNKMIDDQPQKPKPRPDSKAPAVNEQKPTLRLTVEGETVEIRVGDRWNFEGKKGSYDFEIGEVEEAGDNVIIRLKVGSAIREREFTKEIWSKFFSASSKLERGANA